jgi:hypothetical protein
MRARCASRATHRHGGVVVRVFEAEGDEGVVDALEGNFVASFESGGLNSGAVDEDGEGGALQVAQHRLAAAQLQRRVLA